EVAAEIARGAVQRVRHLGGGPQSIARGRGGERKHQHERAGDGARGEHAGPGSRRSRRVQRVLRRGLRRSKWLDSVGRVSDAVVIAPPSPVGLGDVVRVARGAPLIVADAVWPRVDAAHAQFRRLQASDRLVYGVNTGCGPLCEHLVPLADVPAFQANLVRSHASGLGAWHPREVARATLAVRALTLAQGRSGVRRAVVEMLVALLNADVCPCIPETGSVGASGDLVELAHVALAVMA